jgi:beta-galactosidase
VAVVHDYDSRFALEIQPTNQSLDYRNSIQTHFEALRKLGLGVDLIAPSAALNNYRLVVAPNLYVIDRQLAEHLARYVADGGVLVLAPRSAIKDRSNAMPERPLPAYLDGLTGVRVVDYRSLQLDETAAIESADMPLVGRFSGWYEQLNVRDADVVARYVSGSFAGSAAITARQHGRGRVLYLAGTGDQETVDKVLRSVVQELGLRSRELPPDVEVVPLLSRSGAPMSLILNHSDVAHDVQLPGTPWRKLMGGVSRVGSLELAPYGVEVLLSESVLLPEEASR